MKRKTIAVLLCSLFSSAAISLISYERFRSLENGEGPFAATREANWPSLVESALGDFYMRLWGGDSDNSPILIAELDERTRTLYGDRPLENLTALSELAALCPNARHILICPPPKTTGRYDAGAEARDRFYDAIVKHGRFDVAIPAERLFPGKASLKKVQGVELEILEKIKGVLSSDPILLGNYYFYRAKFEDEVAFQAKVSPASISDAVFDAFREYLKDRLLREAARQSGPTFMQPAGRRSTDTSATLEERAQALAVETRLQEAFFSSLSKRLLETPEASLYEIAKTLREEVARNRNETGEPPETDDKLSLFSVRRKGIPIADARFDDVSTTDRLRAHSFAATEGSSSVCLSAPSPDPDGVVRLYPLVIRFEDRLYPSPALAIFLKTRNVEFKDVQVVLGGRLTVPKGTEREAFQTPIDHRGRIRIRYPGSFRKDGRFERVSYGRLIEKAFDASLGQPLPRPSANALELCQNTKDKFLLAGAVSKRFETPFQTPFDREAYSIEAEAAALSTLLSDHPLESEPSQTRDLLLALAFSAAMALSASSFGLIARRILIVGLFLCLLYLGYYLFEKFGIFAGVFHAALSGAATILIFRTGLYFLVERRLNRIEGRYRGRAGEALIERIQSESEAVRLRPKANTVVVARFRLLGLNAIEAEFVAEAGRLFALVEKYYLCLSRIIEERKGLVLESDQADLSAIFGAPFSGEQDAATACAAALEAQRQLRLLRQDFERRGIETPIDLTAGIEIGPAVFGAINPTPQNRDSNRVPAVLGPTASAANFFRSLNPRYQTHLIISQGMAERVKDLFETRMLDRVSGPGFEGGVSIFELIAEKSKADPVKKVLIGYYHEALRLYFNREFDKAAAAFHSLAQKAGDLPSRTLFERCQKFRLKEPPENWDGAYRPEETP